MADRTIKIYKDLMGANAEWAAKTRAVLAEHRLPMINMIGAPGCGKTYLLEKTIAALMPRMRFAVLEGDVATTRDAERLAPLGIPVSQLLTGGACHLEAKLVHHALLDLPLAALDAVVVENVGNMVCPAEFDIGEQAKVAVLSVTEGEDKPLKYPLLFRECKVVVVTKLDLLLHVPFNLDVCMEYLREVNAEVPIFPVSALDGRGMTAWQDWLLALRG